jgi:hypothetical protein
MVRRKRQHVGHAPPKSVLVACSEQRSASSWAHCSFFTRLILFLACGLLRRCSLSPGRCPGRLQDHHRGRSPVWVPLGRNAYGSPISEGKEGQKKPPGSQDAVTKPSPASQVTRTPSACSPIPRKTSAGMSPRSDMKSQDFFFSSGLPFCITRTSEAGKREPTERKNRISLSPGGSPRRLQDHYRGKSSDWISVGRNVYGSEPAEPKNGAKMLKFHANKPPVYRAGASGAAPESANASGIR